VALHTTSGRTRLGVALATTTMLAWATLPIALSVLLQAIGPETLTWFRFAVSGAVLTAYLGLRGGLPKLRGLSRVEWSLLAIAVIGLASNYVLFLIGLEMTTPANVQVLMQLSPLLLAIGGIAIFGERFNRTQWIGFGVLIGGLGLFFSDQLREFVDDGPRYLLGCAVLTGFGAVQEAAKVRAGQEIAVFGCGGVGLNIIQAAALVGAKTIVAIDTDPAKLVLASRFGATHTLGADTEAIHKEIRQLTEERQGVDYVFDAVGSVEIARIGYQSICKGGEVVLVGIAHFKDKLSLSQIVTVTQEKCVRGTTQGSANPWVVVPKLVSLYEEGKLRLDELVSRSYRLEEVNQAMQDLRDGKNARGIIAFQ